MAYFIDPSGRSTFGIGVCARCWRKFSLEDLYSDPNSPGLKVCLDDLDDYDPYRLPARRTEDVTLPFYRPDERLFIEQPTPNVALFGLLTAQNGNLLVTQGGDKLVLQGPDPIVDQ